MKNQLFFLMAFMLIISCKKNDTDTDPRPKDIDGNVYDTVKIGTQVWMVQNLKTTRYNDGSSIDYVPDNTQWNNLTTGAYCYYDNTTANNETYGKLYNWFAVNTGKLAPVGWHIPTDAEWTTLSTYLGGDSIAGNKMKGTTLWTPFAGITNNNSSGFTGIPAGQRTPVGLSISIGNKATFWSSTEESTFMSWFHSLSYNASNIDRIQASKENGMSVRCIRN